MANGANVGNAVLKFATNGTYLGEYPGWYNFPHDIIVGGDDQVMMIMMTIMMMIIMMIMMTSFWARMTM